jgi:uncharacterized membrane protein YhaH (DUF805 family)
MEAFAQFLSPVGRIARNPFALGAVPVYALIVATYLSQPLQMRSGVAPFALAQLVLTYAWYVLHAKRLRDAGYGTGWALVIALLYCLGAALFLALAQLVSVFEADKPGSFLVFILVLLFLVALVTGNPGPIASIALGYLFVTGAPLLIALGFSIWAGTRPPLPAGDAAP